MTEQELRKLRRVDLLEILLDLSKENEVLRTQLEKARTQLTSRTIAIEKSGTLAEAALRINGVFEAAQAACEQYTLNLQQRVSKQEEICREMEQRTQEKCDQMLREAEQEAEASRLEAKSRLAEAQKLADACLAKAEEEASAVRASIEQESTTGLSSARLEADEIRATAQREADDYRTAAQKEADECRATAQKEADEIRAGAEAYRAEAEKAVKEMVDSYSWLSKVLN